jgi:hypothetical protein
MEPTIYLDGVGYGISELRDTPFVPREIRASLIQCLEQIGKHQRESNYQAACGVVARLGLPIQLLTKGTLLGLDPAALVAAEPWIPLLRSVGIEPIIEPSIKEVEPEPFELTSKKIKTVMYHGKEYTYKDLGELLGMNKETIRYRMKKGIPLHNPIDPTMSANAQARKKRKQRDLPSLDTFLEETETTHNGTFPPEVKELKNEVN